MSEESSNDHDTLYQVGYVSTETGSLDSSELLLLLEGIRARNTARHITGLLLHRKDSFFQILEGPRQTVEQTVREIEDDSRHNNLRLLFKKPITEREFGDWQMGFLQLDNIDMGKIPGFSKFLQCPDQPQEFLEELSQSKRLALLFRELS